MNITPDQTIILGLQIFLDHRLSMSFLLSVFRCFFLFVFQSFCPCIFVSFYLCLFIFVHLCSFKIANILLASFDMLLKDGAPWLTISITLLLQLLSITVRILQYIISSLYVMCVHKTACILPWNVVGPQLRNFQSKYLFMIC